MRTITILLLSCASLLGEHFYIAQTNLGTGDGTSAANAKAAYAFFNNSANWDSVVNTTNGKIGPGDTVHIVGVITATGGTQAPTEGGFTMTGDSTNRLIFQGSGTSGNPITLKFDSGAQLRHTTSFDTGLIYLTGGVHDIVVEGGNPSPVIAVYNGTTDFRAPAGYQEDIVITDNGTTKANQIRATRYIYGDNIGSNVTIRNLWMYGIYVRTYQHASDRAASGSGISLRTSGGNVAIENCALVHGETGPSISAQGTVSGTVTGWRISDCLVLDCSNGIKMGIGPSVSVVDGALIVRNRIDHNQRWGGIVTNGFHSDGIQTISQGGGRCDNMHVAYNRIGPYMGLSGDITAYIFLEDFVNGFKIYNNILEKGSGGHTSNPVITSAVHPTFAGQPFERRSIIAFNTIIHNDPNTQLSTAINGGTALIVGNIVYRTSYYLLLDNNDSFAGGPLNNWVDYNVYYGANETQPMSMRGATVGGNGGYSVASWLAATPYDDNSLFTSNPLFVSTTVPADPRLQSASPARNLVPTTIDGFDLTTLFTDDYNGTARGAGPWDAGAIKFGGAGPSVPVVSSSAINAAGTQLVINFNETIRFGTGGNGGLIVSSNGGTVTLGTPVVAGSTITWPITNRLIGVGETLTRTYVQPGNGIESVATGLDLPSFTSSAIANSSTVSQAATPQFAPIPGAYSSTQNVAITSTTSGAPGFSIRYTTDGTDPTASSTLYTAPIPTSLSTTYKARAFATGFLDSPIATGAYSIGDFIIGNAWTNIAVANQTGTFTWTFRATSSTSPNDAVLGLTNKTVAAYADLGVIARFAASGRIDAWNDGPVTKDYAAVNPFPYVAGQAYDFVVTVNIPTHTYSMTVVQAGGSSPTVIATNYGFRGVQATATNLNNFGAISTGGSVTVSNMLFSTAAPTLSLTGIATNTAGTQITATFNSQPSFGLGGQGGFTVSASGGATTPASPIVGANSITWNLSRTIGRGETISATYVQPGNGIEAASGGSDLASFAGQSAANNSTVDTTAPTPNPSTFGISPTALTSSTITMTATTSTDAATPPVQYFFNEVSGNAGGSDSGWQSSATFTDAGLAAGTQYRYRVQVRDSAVPPNVTTFSTEFSATTKSVAGARPAQPFNMARANIVTP